MNRPPSQTGKSAPTRHKRPATGPVPHPPTSQAPSSPAPSTLAPASLTLASTAPSPPLFRVENVQQRRTPTAQINVFHSNLAERAGSTCKVGRWPGMEPLEWETFNRGPVPTVQLNVFHSNLAERERFDLQGGTTAGHGAVGVGNVQQKRVPAAYLNVSHSNCTTAP